ncbi:hypothetical protein [Pseudonocardia kunmingensis]|uniref:hypothetical protein n=1 Tax=Pseudonocardia kunmingensis TaxID=630975 RepID=UPI0011501B5D|nr:hypothetical protein [Pseudonocardia kunmingensis]
MTDDARGHGGWPPSPWILVVLLTGLLLGACGASDDGGTVPGCLGTGGRDVPVTVGQPTPLTASVSTGACPDFPAVPQDQDQDLFKDEIVVGDHVQLRLVAPLLPVRIEPVSAEVQLLLPDRPETTWQWQIVADEPGLHRLSIVASVVGADGAQVLLENRQIEVRLHATATMGWYLGRAWEALAAFVMSAQGVLAGIAALVSAAGGAWLARRRARQAAPSDSPAPTERDRDPSGYL